MNNKLVTLALGALTGLVSLIAMIRLVAGAFSGGVSAFAWIFILLAMVPFIAYAAWRARHGHLSTRGRILVSVLIALGLVSVWMFTIGAVLALACSLAAFVVIWVSDWPPRQPRGESRFVHIDELTADDTD